MRIFQLSGDRGIEPDGTKGASVHLASIARAFHRAGHEIVLLARREARDPKSFPFPVLPYRSAADLDRAAEAFGEPDAVYERHALGELLGVGVHFARKRGIPIAVEVNAPLALEAKLHRPHSITADAETREAQVMSEADLIFCVSHPLAAWAAAIRGTSSGIIVQANGFDPVRFPRRAELGDDRVVFLGHPKPWHGRETLLALAEELRRREIPSAELLIVGGGRGAEELLSEAASRGLGDRLRASDEIPQDQILHALDGAALTVAPYPESDFFYFSPLKIVESLAAGLPVATSAVGDIPELVGDAGMVLPPGDDAGFSNAVIDLLADRKRRLALGAAGRRRALARHSFEDIGRRIVDALRKLPARGRAL